MAASSGKEGSGSESESEQCEETNVFSPQFDALRAIHDTTTPLPCPEAKPFEDILKFLSHYNRLLDLGKVGRPSSSTVGTSGSDTRAGGSGTAKRDQIATNTTRAPSQHDSSTGNTATKSVPSKSDRRITTISHANVSHTGTSVSQDQGDRRRNRTVFGLMEDADGPLSLLKWCFENKQKAKVCTRTFKGLRSVCIGYVVAFDKFFNLALSDVTEIYRKPPLGKTIYHQETLTVSKILQQFTLSQKVNKETQKKEKKKTRNRKERKVRLEERLKAAGIFVENYHPPQDMKASSIKERIR